MPLPSPKEQYEDPLKKKIELPYDLAIPLQGIYPEKMKILIEKVYAPQCSQRHYLQ